MKQKGEFQKAREERIKHQQIYDLINAACKEAEEKGTATVTVAKKKYYLVKEANYALHYYAFLKEAKYAYLHYYAFLRVKKYGLVFCDVCVKDRGYQQPIFPKLSTMYIAKPKVAAYVMKVEDVETKELLFFNPEQTYIEAETENSWWRRKR